MLNPSGETGESFPIEAVTLLSPVTPGKIIGIGRNYAAGARDLQKKDVQFTRAKGFDTFCPTGPWIETELDPTRVRVQARVNGQVRQDGNTADLIFPVRRLVRFLAGIMTLMPGDLLATGTPAGVGPLSAGDMVEIEVENVGVLRNPVQ